MFRKKIYRERKYSGYLWLEQRVRRGTNMGMRNIIAVVKMF